MRPFFCGGVYVNILSNDEGAHRVRAAYGDNYDRLLGLKRKYDPLNFFRFNQNINPAQSFIPSSGKTNGSSHVLNCLGQDKAAAGIALTNWLAGRYCQIGRTF